MISIPIFVFVLLIVASCGHFFYWIFWVIARKKDKKEYYRYLEEEYGKNITKGKVKPIVVEEKKN